jgi:hypothetical protein
MCGIGAPPIDVALGMCGIGAPPIDVALGICGIGAPPIDVAFGICGIGAPPMDVVAHEVLESPTDAKLFRSVTLANTTTRANKKARVYRFIRLFSSWEFEGLRTEKPNGAKA